MASGRCHSLTVASASAFRPDLLFSAAGERRCRAKRDPDAKRRRRDAGDQWWKAPGGRRSTIGRRPSQAPRPVAGRRGTAWACRGRRWEGAVGRKRRLPLRVGRVCVSLDSRARCEREVHFLTSTRLTIRQFRSLTARRRSFSSLPIPSASKEKSRFLFVFCFVFLLFRTFARSSPVGHIEQTASGIDIIEWSATLSFYRDRALIEMLDVKAQTSEDHIHGRPAPISNFPMLLTSGTAFFKFCIHVYLFVTGTILT